MKLEINMIVSDAKAAGDFYQKVLQAKLISQTDEETTMNETVMLLAGVEVRILNENQDFGMFAPVEGAPVSMGINLYVDDIESFFDNAIAEGCKAISPVQAFPDVPAKNAVFSDKFNHVWVINQQY